MRGKLDKYIIVYLISMYIKFRSNGFISRNL